MYEIGDFEIGQRYDTYKSLATGLRVFLWHDSVCICCMREK